MPELTIKIRNKHPIYEHEAIVCGNSDYVVRWDLDEEWAEYAVKTMRVVYLDGTTHDVVFTGDTVAMPIITVPGAILVGIYAGDMHSTTSAVWTAQSSIYTKGGTPVPPPRKCVCPAYGNAEGRQDQGPQGRQRRPRTGGA